MIENISKLCREQPNDGTRGEQAAAAAMERLAELWAEEYEEVTDARWERITVIEEAIRKVLEGESDA